MKGESIPVTVETIQVQVGCEHVEKAVQRTDTGIFTPDQMAALHKLGTRRGMENPSSLRIIAARAEGGQYGLRTSVVIVGQDQSGKQRLFIARSEVYSQKDHTWNQPVSWVTKQDPEEYDPDDYAYLAAIHDKN